MTTTIIFKNKNYGCEFIENVYVRGQEINGKCRIYACRYEKRVFLIDEYNKVLAQCYKNESWQLDSILDEDDIHHDSEILNLCEEFEQLIYDETGDEVMIINN